MEERWMTVNEVADYLHVSPDLIYRLAQRKKIPASKIGGRWRFKRDKIDVWMENERKSEQPGEAGVTTQTQAPPVNRSQQAER